jgi:lysophospholipase L1-like esterase
MMKQFSIKFLLVALTLVFLGFIPAQKKITIFSIGDSTMASYDVEEWSKRNGGKNYPLRGWMMAMPQFFNQNVTIKNAAISGISSKSFRDEGAWQKVIDEVEPGDYVFIQFGHNDEKPDTASHTDATTSFRQNLINYINETKAKGAYPVLFTSIVRRKFNSSGRLEDTHGDYVTVVRELAKEKNIPLVDLNKKTCELVESLGPEESKKLYLYIQPGLFTQLPQGKQDDTHLCEYGATKFAELAVQGIKELNLGLVKYLK